MTAPITLALVVTAFLLLASAAVFAKQEASRWRSLCHRQADALDRAVTLIKRERRIHGLHRRAAALCLEAKAATSDRARRRKEAALKLVTSEILVMERPG